MDLRSTSSTSETRRSRGSSEDAFELPIVFRDSTQIGAIYAVPLDAARELTPPSVEPWPIAGRAMVAVYAWQHRDTSIGPYGELGIGVLTRLRGEDPSLLRLAWDMGAQDEQGIWVLNLPVTSERARAGGVEVWGYPKYIAPIAMTLTRDEATVRLGDELELSVGALRGLRIPAPTLVTFTELEGDLVRTRFDVDYRVRWGAGSAAKLRILGEGPSATTAKSLGLERARPLAALRADKFRARLPEGRVVTPRADRSAPGALRRT